MAPTTCTDREPVLDVGCRPLGVSMSKDTCSQTRWLDVALTFRRLSMGKCFALVSPSVISQLLHMMTFLFGSPCHLS